METTYETKERLIREIEEQISSLEKEADEQSDVQEKRYIEEEIEGLENKLKEIVSE